MSERGREGVREDIMTNIDTNHTSNVLVSSLTNEHVWYSSSLIVIFNTWILVTLTSEWIRFGR